MAYDQQISILLVRTDYFQRVTTPERTSSTAGLVQNGCLTLAMTFSFQSLAKTTAESRQKLAMRLPCKQRPREIRRQLRHTGRRKAMTRGQVEGIMVRLMTQLCMSPLASTMSWLTSRRAAERRGVENRALGRAIAGRADANAERSLEQEFEYLYHHREEINARMSAIKAGLTEAEYQKIW
jgi:hypothetical protein